MKILLESLFNKKIHIHIRIGSNITEKVIWKIIQSVMPLISMLRKATVHAVTDAPIWKTV